MSISAILTGNGSNIVVQMCTGNAQ